MSSDGPGWAAMGPSEGPDSVAVTLWLSVPSPSILDERYRL